MNFKLCLKFCSVAAFLMSPTLYANESISIPIQITFESYCEVVNTTQSIDFTANSIGDYRHDFDITWRCVGGNGKKLNISFSPIILPNGSEVVIAQRDGLETVTSINPAVFSVNDGNDVISHFTAIIGKDDIKALSVGESWSGRIEGVLELN